VARPIPIGRCRGGALDILFEHQPVFDKPVSGRRVRDRPQNAPGRRCRPSLRDVPLRAVRDRWSHPRIECRSVGHNINQPPGWCRRLIKMSPSVAFTDGHWGRAAGGRDCPSGPGQTAPLWSRAPCSPCFIRLRSGIGNSIGRNLAPAGGLECPRVYDAIAAIR
jgi:hypothetical protein